jgi:Ribosomal protein S19E (S16A)
MVSVRDVNGQIFVERLAKYLFENYKDIIKPPSWAFFIKTGPDKERNPDFPADVDYNGGPGWWYYRAASILRKVYLYGPIGISRLRRKYSGLRKRGMEPGKVVKGYGKINKRDITSIGKCRIGYEVNEGKKKEIVTIWRSL